MAQSDYVVVAAALTEETQGLVNQKCFDASRPGQVLINVGRGAVVDDAALLNALRSGRSTHLNMICL
jgi:phosphoglycerate dehydrogenase-like enzyme